MRKLVKLDEFVRCDRDFSEYDSSGFRKGRLDIVKFIHFQSHIDEKSISISVGYTDSDTSVNCWYSCTKLECEGGVLPYSELIEWYKDLENALFEDDHPDGMVQYLINKMDEYINKSQKVYAMFQEGLL